MRRKNLLEEIKAREESLKRIEKVMQSEEDNVIVAGLYLKKSEVQAIRDKRKRELLHMKGML